ncbi:AAA family ATPase [uncultured Pseudoalteromonas sp.]|uniref:ParA family protein n=1 Tax=uncultured Pseudoalteromonas sp. TaxID=114053 RepID=UPI00259849D4|nr:AAA family ATPase [uncultured Pseudoalteromonas sp.]
MSENSIEKTDSAFRELGIGATNHKLVRNHRLLSKNQKAVRRFTRAESLAYLDINARTLDKYASLVNIDPRRHTDYQWLLDIEEIYKIRDSLPAELRKVQKFKRGPNEKLQVISVQNQKGGVGKTITVATIASCLAVEFHQELRIGVIDMDGQASLTAFYATKSEALGELSAGDLISGDYELDEGETKKQVISNAFLPTTIPNLRILPAAQSDRVLEGWFHKGLLNGTLSNPYSILKDIINEVEDEFDIILIDTPPSLGYATYNAYFAATSVVFPLAVTEADIDATCSYFEFIVHMWELLRSNDHQGYDFMKMLITNHRDSSTTSDLLTGLYDNFSEFLYSKEFKYSEAVRQCHSKLSTVFDMSKSDYPKTKTSFQATQSNAYEIASQLYRDIAKVWRDSSKEEK